MRVPTVEKLRNAIDRGRLRDKVAASDPAAAPLGTDEEAAGTPVSPAARAQAAADLARNQPSIDTRSRPRLTGLAQFIVWIVATAALFLVTWVLLAP